MSIPNAISSLANATMIPFIIKNNIPIKPVRSLVTLWSPWEQLGLNDGTNNLISSNKSSIRHQRGSNDSQYPPESSFRQVTDKHSTFFEKK